MTGPTEPELEHDARLFRKLNPELTEVEKKALLAKGRESYKAYEQELNRLARIYGIRVRP